MLSRGFFKMLDSENISACKVGNNRALNERNINKINEQRFALTTKTQLNELVSNAQVQSTKAKTICAVNIFKGRRHLNNINIDNISVYNERSKANLRRKVD